MDNKFLLYFKNIFSTNEIHKEESSLFSKNKNKELSEFKNKIIKMNDCDCDDSKEKNKVINELKVHTDKLSLSGEIPSGTFVLPSEVSVLSEDKIAINYIIVFDMDGKVTGISSNILKECGISDVEFSTYIKGKNLYTLFKENINYYNKIQNVSLEEKKITYMFSTFLIDKWYTTKIKLNKNEAGDKHKIVFIMRDVKNN